VINLTEIGSVEFNKMKKIIHPGKYVGEINAPASKSYLQRAIALAVLSNQTVLDGYEPSKDADAAISIAKELNSKIEIKGSKLVIQGGDFFHKKLVVNCNESGLSTRMFSVIASLSDQEFIISGKGSLLKRPMNIIVDALTKFGKTVESNNGFLPLRITGKMKAGEVNIDGSESSQLLSGLLIALPFLNENSIVKVENPVSIPYIKMTLAILSDFGIEIIQSDFKKFSIKGNQLVKTKNYKVEGDWSGAAFHLVAGAIGGAVDVYNLNSNSFQADAKIVEALKKCGATVLVDDEKISVTKNKLIAFKFDATDCPDLFPPLAVLAACCECRSEIIGVSRLKNKESDRGKTIQSEFKKLGIEIEIHGNSMFINGGKVNGGKVESHNDHRIAMALAILGLVADDAVEIDGAEAVEKSYPKFFDDFEKLIKR